MTTLRLKQKQAQQQQKQSKSKTPTTPSPTTSIEGSQTPSTAAKENISRANKPSVLTNGFRTLITNMTGQKRTTVSVSEATSSNTMSFNAKNQLQNQNNWTTNLLNQQSRNIKEQQKSKTISTFLSINT